MTPNSEPTVTQPTSTTPAAPRLALLVLRSEDLVKARGFYEALGLSFVEEQHGKGPVHLAASWGGMVLELYPASPKRPGTSSVRLGFAVAHVEATIDALVAAGGELLSPPKSSPWGVRAVLADPDQHRVELLQESTS